MRLALIGALLLGVATAPAAAEDAAPHWTYTGDEGPDFWGDLDETFAACSLGNQQSPVDFLGVQASETPGLTLPSGSFTPDDIVNNGHTIRVGVPAGVAMTLDGQAYELKQIHFHAPAEHTLNGVLYPMEMHLVHQAEDGALAVLGVLMMEGAANPSLSPVFAALPAEGPAQPLDATIDVADLLPASSETFSYRGSLTTPPCDEGVTWDLFAEPITVAPEEMRAYQTLLPETARPVQRQLTAEDAAATPQPGSCDRRSRAPAGMVRTPARTVRPTARPPAARRSRDRCPDRPL